MLLSCVHHRSPTQSICASCGIAHPSLSVRALLELTYGACITYGIDLISRTARTHFAHASLSLRTCISHTFRAHRARAEHAMRGRVLRIAYGSNTHRECIDDVLRAIVAMRARVTCASSALRHRSTSGRRAGKNLRRAHIFFRGLQNTNRAPCDDMRMMSSHFARTTVARTRECDHVDTPNARLSADRMKPGLQRCAYSYIDAVHSVHRNCAHHERTCAKRAPMPSRHVLALRDGVPEKCARTCNRCIK